jgi:hypothetical protein
MQCKSVMCVRANSRQAWLPVVEKTISGVSYVPLNSTRTPWATRFLNTGKGKQRDPTECGLALKAFEQEVRSRATPAQTKDQYDSASPDAKTKRGGCALALDSDGDDDDVEHGSSSEDSERPAASDTNPRKRSRIQQTTVKSKGLLSILLGDTDAVAIQVGFGKGPGLLLEAVPENVFNVLSYVDEQFDRLAALGRTNNLATLGKKTAASSQTHLPAQPAASGHQSDKPKATSIDTGRVRFDLKAGGYLIFYADAEGKARRISAGFLVPRSDYMGHPLPVEKYQEAKCAVLHKARAKWDSMDMSTNKRYN